MTRWLLLAALALAPAAAARAAPSLSADKCPFVETLTPDERARVRCGHIHVPEDHAKPNGRKIELAVAVVEPKSNKTADPVVMLHGGPGGGEVDAYRFRLGEPLGPRTLVLFDQRGVGRSRPQFCPELGDAVFAASVRGLSPDAETAELVAAHRRCYDRLIAEGVDLTKYNTAATVADAEAIRTALGYPRWKVYGISYGTAVGLAYLRDRPQSIAALVLDSVYPLDAPGASQVLPNMMHALRQLSAECARQQACKERFGDVEALFNRALEDLARGPLDVPPLGATASWTEPVKISASAFLAVVHQLLYDRTAYAALPYLIDRVAARDGEVFALLVDQFHERANAITHGANAAVECYERLPFDSRDDYALASAEWPLARDRMTLIVRSFDICANWGVHAPAPMQMPGPTNVPALVLGATWDPITPTAYAKRAAEAIGAHYVELPFHGHGVRGDKACGAPMIRAFLDRPDRAPDSACTRQAKPPLFATSLIRAPAVARELTALASNPASAPTGMTLGGLIAFMLVSTLIWSFVGLTRALRYGVSAWAGFWTRPGVPLGLAALAFCATLGAFGWEIMSAAATQSPILLMIGLPGSSLAAFALPWAAVALLAWGAFILLFGAEKADRPMAYAIHLWLVLAVGVFAVALLASFGLLIPDLI